MNRLNKLLERFLAWQRSKRIRREVKTAISTHPEQWTALVPTHDISPVGRELSAKANREFREKHGLEDWPEIIE